MNINKYKEEFLKVIYDEIKQHPEWMQDVVLVMNKSILDRLDELKTEKADLSYALVTFVLEDKKIKFPYYANIKDGMKVLYSFFRTAPCAKDIKKRIV